MASFRENFTEPTKVDVWIDGEGRLIRLSTTSSEPTDNGDDVFKKERDFWDYDSAPPVKLPSDLYEPAPRTTPGGAGVTSLSGTVRTADGKETSVSAGEGDPDIQFEGRGTDSGSVVLTVTRTPSKGDSVASLGLTVRPARGSVVATGTYPYDDPQEGPEGVPGFTFSSDHLECEPDSRSGQIEMTEAILEANGRPVRLTGNFSLSCASSREDPPETLRTFIGQIRYHSLVES